MGNSKIVNSLFWAITNDKQKFIQDRLKEIDKAKKKGLSVASYDRNKESRNSKRHENSSIVWGVSSCLKSNPPDIIYHKGDIGKEPMILIFGKNPDEIIRKVSKLASFR